MLRVVFMGTAEIACPTLRALVADPGVQVVGVVTQPDKPRGRDLELSPPAVKVAAQGLGLPVYQPVKAREPGFVTVLRGLEPDVVVVIAYGQLLPQVVLDVPRFGCLNVHTSLLPRHRGAAPIQWALLEGDTETGISLMRMDAGLDTGPVVAVSRTPILDGDTASSLHDRLAVLGAELVVKVLPGYVAGEVQPVAQALEGVSHARKISREDGELDWTMAAEALRNRFRAFTPWPGVYTWRVGVGGAGPILLKVLGMERVAGMAGTPGTILEARGDRLVVACGEGALNLTSLQREGGKRLATRAFLAGMPLEEGSRLGRRQAGAG